MTRWGDHDSGSWAARIIAEMPARIAAGSVGQASMTLAKSAWAGPAFTFSPSLVQVLAQAAGEPANSAESTVSENG